MQILYRANIKTDVYSLRLDLALTLLPETPTLVSAIKFLVLDKGRINQMRKINSKILHPN